MNIAAATLGATLDEDEETPCALLVADVPDAAALEDGSGDEEDPAEWATDAEDGADVPDDATTVLTAEVPALEEDAPPIPDDDVDDDVPVIPPSPSGTDDVVHAIASKPRTGAMDFQCMPKAIPERSPSVLHGFA